MAVAALGLVVLLLLQPQRWLLQARLCIQLALHSLERTVSRPERMIVTISVHHMSLACRAGCRQTQAA